MGLTGGEGSVLSAPGWALNAGGTTDDDEAGAARGRLEGRAGQRWARQRRPRQGWAWQRCARMAARRRRSRRAGGAVWLASGLGKPCATRSGSSSSCLPPRMRRCASPRRSASCASRPRSSSPAPSPGCSGRSRCIRGSTSRPSAGGPRLRRAARRRGAARPRPDHRSAQCRGHRPHGSRVRRHRHRHHRPAFADGHRVLAKSASGGLEHVPFVVVRNLAEALIELGERGFTRVGLDSEAPETLDAVGPRTPLLWCSGPRARVCASAPANAAT